MTEDVRGVRDAYTSTSKINSQNYQIKQYLRNVHTNFIGIVQDCASDEENTGATTVSILPAISQTDGQDNAMQMATIPKCPFTRYQYGVAAVIIDPVAGDKVVCHALKNDSTTLDEDTSEPQRPGSLREFSQSNSIAGVAVHTQTPQNWAVLRQDLTRETYAPEGVKNRTDKDYAYEIGQDHKWTIGRNAEHTIGNDVTIQIGNNCTITIGADETITISGNFTGTIQGNADLAISGTTSITSNGDMTITAPQVTVDTPQATFTGDVSISGNLNQATDGGGGYAEFGGSVHAAGAISSDSDVTSNVSLNSHTHSGVETGGGSTGGPQ